MQLFSSGSVVFSREQFHIECSRYYSQWKIWILYLKNYYPNFQWSVSKCHLPQCHIHESLNWVSIGSDISLSPIRCQAIIWTNIDLLSIEPLGTKLCEIPLKIQYFSLIKMLFKMSSPKWRPFCPDLERWFNASGDVMGMHHYDERSISYLVIFVGGVSAAPMWCIYVIFWH